jgi:antitoxin MazE
MRIQVKKWGNRSLVVDQAPGLREGGRRIIIEPVRAPIYDLDQMLEEMRPDTFPDEVDFSPAVGREFW